MATSIHSPDETTIAPERIIDDEAGRYHSTEIARLQQDFGMIVRQPFQAISQETEEVDQPAVPKHKMVTMADGDVIAVDEKGCAVAAFPHPRTGMPSHPRVVDRKGGSVFMWY